MFRLSQVFYFVVALGLRGGYEQLGPWVGLGLTSAVYYGTYHTVASLASAHAALYSDQI